MRALLLKDLRLAMDMLLPWSLIVGGFLASMLVLVALPVDLRPDFAARFGVVDVLQFTIVVTGMTAFASAAWAATCVVGGDARHGGRLLDLALPAAPAVRAASKHAAIAAAALAPACVVLLAGLMTPRAPGVHPLSPGATWLAALLTAGACLTAAWLALHVASVVRGAFSAVFVTILCGGAAALMGLLGMRLAVVWLALDYRGVDGADAIVGIAWKMCAVPAGAVGAGTAAILGLGWGTAAIMAPRRPATRFAFAPVALVAATVAGAVSAHATLPAAIESRLQTLFATGMARAQDDEGLAREVRRIIGARNAAAPEAAPGWLAKLPVRDHVLLHEARLRASRLPFEERERSPVVAALREALSASDQRRANENAIFAIPGDAVALALMLEAARLHPEDMYLKLRVGYQASTVIGLPFDPDLLGGSETERSRSVDDYLRPILERLLESDFPDKDLVRAVLSTLQDRPGE